MTLLDIFSEAMAHHTKIPKSFVRDHLSSFSEKDEKKAKMLKIIMNTRLEPYNAKNLLDRLLESSFSDTMAFLVKGIRSYKYEVERQALVN